MINYSRFGYEIKRDFTKLFFKNFKRIKAPAEKIRTSDGLWYTSIHKDSIFLAELKECSKRIYGMPKFIFYALGYALERVLSMCRSGISSFLPPKVKSQQLDL